MTVINDAYNANPESMAAALRTLAQLGRTVDQATGQPHRTWAVLGAMLELGDASLEEHDRIRPPRGAHEHFQAFGLLGDETEAHPQCGSWKGSWVMRRPG